MIRPIKERLDWLALFALVFAALLLGPFLAELLQWAGLPARQ
jgi:hypothetical protein